MAVAQNGKCAICGYEFLKGKPQNCHIDHNHTTGKIRGLLCAKCNLLLGCANDNIPTLYKAIDYLKQIESSIYS